MEHYCYVTVRVDLDTDGKVIDLTVGDQNDTGIYSEDSDIGWEDLSLHEHAQTVVGATLYLRPASYR